MKKAKGKFKFEEGEKEWFIENYPKTSTKECAQRLNIGLTLARKLALNLGLKKIGKVLPLEGEIWREVVGFENYMVSNYGRLKSVERTICYKDGREKANVEKLVKTYRNKRGYIAVGLSGKEGRKRLLVHRLVAEAFIPNPENKPFIDHINTIRTDNRIENLRWCTRVENANNPLTIVKMREGVRAVFSDPIRGKIVRTKMSEEAKKKWRDENYVKKRSRTISTEENIHKRRMSHPKRRNVIHYDENGYFVDKFFSIRQAAKHYSHCPSIICDWCTGKHKPLNKHIWKYATNEEFNQADKNLEIPLNIEEF